MESNLFTYYPEQRSLVFKIDGIMYDIQAIFDKEELNFSFKITIFDLRREQGERTLGLADINDLHSFAHGVFYKRHARKFNTKEEVMLFEACYHGIQGHAYYMSGLIWDFRRKLGHKTPEILKDYNNGCGKLVTHIKNSQR